MRGVTRPASACSIAHSAKAVASTREHRALVMAQAMQCPANLLDTAITSLTEAEVRERAAVSGDVNTVRCDGQRMLGYEVEQFVVSLEGE